MRLAELLHERREAILQEFEEFARTHTSLGSSMNVEALRDHASKMLDAMALDLEQTQTDAEQEQKGKGDAWRTKGAPRTAAEEHGLGRAQSGFSLEETFAEYRALRASVMRHYIDAVSQPNLTHVLDMIRYNEAMDQALAESISEYAQAVTHYRDMFLAMLGHDLRSPLNAILASSSFMTETSNLSTRDQRLTATITRSAEQMDELIGAMLDYTSSQLGQVLTLRFTSANAGEIVEAMIAQARAFNPGREFRIEKSGDTVGEWDVNRLRQIVSNLVTNALKHGAEAAPITVTVSGEKADQVVLAVHNEGAPIPVDEWELIFEPFRQASTGSSLGERGGMGLGLYIARRMAEAHNGTVRVLSSDDGGTTFTAILPRRPE